MASDLFDTVHKARQRSRLDCHTVDDLVVFVRPEVWLPDYAGRSVVGGWTDGADRLPDRLAEYGDPPSVTLFGLPVYGRAYTDDPIADVRCMWRGISRAERPVPPPHATGDLRAYSRSGWSAWTINAMRSAPEAYIGVETYEVPVLQDISAPAGAYVFRCHWGR